MDVKNVSVFKQEGSKGELPKTNSISELAMDIYMGPGRKGVSVMTQEEYNKQMQIFKDLAKLDLSDKPSEE